MPRLLRSVFRCVTCDTVIESRFRYDYVYCNCPEDSETRIFADGGTVYPKFGYGIEAEYEDLSEWSE